jgi:hypothetical protein
MPHAKNSTTAVRIAVATLPLIPFTPTFANIAVNAAKRADNNA